MPKNLLSAWYVNGPLGLEQGFVLDEAPGCAGTKVVTLEVVVELRAELDDADGDGPRRGGSASSTPRAGWRSRMRASS